MKCSNLCMQRGKKKTSFAFALTVIDACKTAQNHKCTDFVFYRVILNGLNVTFKVFPQFPNLPYPLSPFFFFFLHLLACLFCLLPVEHFILTRDVCLSVHVNQVVCICSYLISHYCLRCSPKVILLFRPRGDNLNILRADPSKRKTFTMELLR